MNGRDEGTGAPTILVIEPRDEHYYEGPGFTEMVGELAEGKFSIEAHTWTDGLMKGFSPIYRVILLDCGRLGDYEFDVIRKLRDELGLPMLLHSTEDRAPVLKSVMAEGVREVFRKPFGVAKLVERIVETLSGSGPGEEDSPFLASGD